MGRHLCRALEQTQGQDFKLLQEDETFTCDTSFFTHADGKVIVPRHVQVLGGDDLPIGTIIETRNKSRAKPAPAVKPSELLGYPHDPGQTLTIDKEEDAKPQELLDAMNQNQAAMGDTPTQIPADASDGPVPTGPAVFDRASAIERLKALGKTPRGNPSNMTLAQLLADAEAAVMMGEVQI